MEVAPRHLEHQRAGPRVTVPFQDTYAVRSVVAPCYSLLFAFFSRDLTT